MKQSNLTTPRTMADARFDTGYANVLPPPPSRAEQVAGYVLGFVIGVASALLLVHWGAQ